LIDISVSERLSSVLSLVDKEIIEFKNFIEFLALFSGGKTIVRLVIDHSQYTDIENFSKTWLPDYFFADAPFLIETVSWITPHDRLTERKPKSESSTGDHVIFIGSKEIVQSALEIENSTCGNTETANIYGYPACCGKKYAVHMESDWWPDSFVKECSSYEKLNYLYNRFSMHHSPMLTYQFDYFPCSPKCKETATISKNNRSNLQSSPLAELSPMIDQHMKAVVVFFKKSFWYIRASQLQDKGIFESSLPCNLCHEKYNEPFLMDSLMLTADEARVIIDGKEYTTEDEEIRVLVFD